MAQTVQAVQEVQNGLKNFKQLNALNITMPYDDSDPNGPNIVRDLSVLYDPHLIEEAVFLALTKHPKAALFHRKRSRLYEIADPEERERAFQELHLAWFASLGLAHQTEVTIKEQPLLLSAVRHFVVGCAPGKRDEGAELFVSPEAAPCEKERRTVRILLRPESLIDSPALLTFLRHELLHITDMLDPGFGYEPALPAAAGGPAHDRLLQERYRALWDATIDGRMVRRGWASKSVHAERLRDFCRAFPMFGEQSDRIFSHFFDREPHTHAELATFACNPRAFMGKSPVKLYPGSRCPLCGFPTHAFEPEPDRLPQDAIALITRDFPQWHPTDGLCTQCADLYRARQVSARAALLLPGSLCHPLGREPLE